MAWRRNLQVSSVGTSAERLGVGADHDGGRAAGAKGAATEETRKGLRLRILPGTGCHRAGPPSKSGARAGGGRSDDFTQSNCGGTEAELATSATTCLHPQPPSRAYICVRNQFCKALLPSPATAHLPPNCRVGWLSPNCPLLQEGRPQRQDRDRKHHARHAGQRRPHRAQHSTLTVESTGTYVTQCRGGSPRPPARHAGQRRPHRAQHSTLTVESTGTHVTRCRGGSPRPPARPLDMQVNVGLTERNILR